MSDHVDNGGSDTSSDSSAVHIHSRHQHTTNQQLSVMDSDSESESDKEADCQPEQQQTNGNKEDSAVEPIEAQVMLQMTPAEFSVETVSEATSTTVVNNQPEAHSLQ